MLSHRSQSRGASAARKTSAVAAPIEPTPVTTEAGAVVVTGNVVATSDAVVANNAQPRGPPAVAETEAHLNELSNGAVAAPAVAALPSNGVVAAPAVMALSTGAVAASPIDATAGDRKSVV